MTESNHRTGQGRNVRWRCCDRWLPLDGHCPVCGMHGPDDTRPRHHQIHRTLTDAQAERIFRARGMFTAESLAEEYGISKSIVWDIWARNSYGNVTDRIPDRS